MTFRETILAHPELTGAQHATLGRLAGEHGTPLAFAMVACAALASWDRLGTVSVREDGTAFKCSTGERL